MYERPQRITNTYWIFLVSGQCINPELCRRYDNSKIISTFAAKGHHHIHTILLDKRQYQKLNYSLYVAMCMCVCGVSIKFHLCVLTPHFILILNCSQKICCMCYCLSLSLSFGIWNQIKCRLLTCPCIRLGDEIRESFKWCKFKSQNQNEKVNSGGDDKTSECVGFYGTRIRIHFIILGRISCGKAILFIQLNCLFTYHQLWENENISFLWFKSM